MSWFTAISFLLMAFMAISIKGFSQEKIEGFNPIESAQLAQGYRYGFYYGRPYYYQPHHDFGPYAYRYYYFHPYHRMHYYYGWE